MQSENANPSVPTTLIYKQFLGILLVAVVLTILEVVSISKVVMPGLKRQIERAMTSLHKEHIASRGDLVTSAESFSDVLQALSLRESVLQEKTNFYINLFGLLFVLLMSFTVLLLVFLIKLEGHRNSDDRGQLRFVFLYAFLTVIAIGIFQGFPCLLSGPDSMFCYGGSFTSMSTSWQYNTNYGALVLSTGICDDNTVTTS